MDALQTWKRHKDARALWESFLDTAAAQEGLRVIQTLAVPQHNIIGDDVFKVAQRHAFCAGIEYAIMAIRQLPHLSSKASQNELKEWDHITLPTHPLEIPE